MALETAATLHADTHLVGWTDPRPYKGGKFKGRDGDDIEFDAGVSMKVCVCHGDKDFTVLKVKTANIGKVRTILEAMKRGDNLHIEYKVRDGQFELVDLRSLVGAK